MTANTDAKIDDTETDSSQEPMTAGARLAARKAAKAARKAAERGKGAGVPDGVQQTAVEAGNWLADHGRTIAIVAALIIVGVAGFVGVQRLMQHGSHDAAEALTKGVKAALAPIGPADEGASSEQETYETADARATKALAGYREVIAKHGGTDAAVWARLGEGSLLLSQDKADEAARAFEAVLAESDDAFVRYRALEGQGFALEAQNKLDDATQKYAEIAKLANGTYKPASDYHLARLLAARGDTQGAKEMFGKLIDTLGEQAISKGERFVALRDEAQLRLQELGGERKTRPNPGMSAVGSEGLTPELLETLRRQLDLKVPGAPEGK